MKVVFAGTPSFAVPSLVALHEVGFPPSAVLTQPDRPAGRGRRLQESPIKQSARSLGIPVYQPQRIGQDTVSLLEELQPTWLITVAYGLILPEKLLEVPSRGGLNVHASLLPRWRGAAPIARAIEAGDRVTGVCIMQMVASLDEGPLWACREETLLEHDTGASLHDRLSTLAAELLINTLKDIESNTLNTPVPQLNEGISYARKLGKKEARIIWSQPMSVLHRKIRALIPWPIAHTHLRDRLVRLWGVGEIEPYAVAGPVPGTLRFNGGRLFVACQDGWLEITELQIEGGRRLTAREFINGYRPIGQAVFGP